MQIDIPLHIHIHTCDIYTHTCDIYTHTYTHVRKHTRTHTHAHTHTLHLEKTFKDIHMYSTVIYYVHKKNFTSKIFCPTNALALMVQTLLKAHIPL